MKAFLLSFWIWIKKLGMIENNIQKQGKRFVFILWLPSAHWKRIEWKKKDFNGIFKNLFWLDNFMLQMSRIHLR